MGLSQPTKDILAGTTGGIAQVLVGQPLDILKVRLQLGSGQYKGVADCAKQIFMHEGPLAFYKGTLTPLLGVGACVSIQFGVVEEMKRLFAKWNLDGKAPANTHDAKSLTGTQLYLSGVVAGVANSVVAAPVEHVRIRLQAQSSLHKSYKGPLDALRQMYSAAGVRGVYHGSLPTILREAHGMGIYFWTYEELVKFSLQYKPRDQLSNTAAMLSGGAAGFTLWTMVYPLDVVKSRMQTDAVKPSERKYSGMVDCAKSIYREGGARAFVRGLEPTLVRAPFANAATFVAVEWAQRQMASW